SLSIGWFGDITDIIDRAMVNVAPIASIKAPRVIAARALSSGSGRLRQRRCLVEGPYAVAWARATYPVVERGFHPEAAPDRALLADLDAHGVQPHPTSQGVLNKSPDTTYLVPIVGVVAPPPEPGRDAAIGDLVLVLDRIQDHGNLGTIVRTASA